MDNAICVNSSPLDYLTDNTLVVLRMDNTICVNSNCWIAINPLDSVIRLLNNWAWVERHGFETRLGHYVVFLGKMFHSYSSYSWKLRNAPA